jgi:hypothetical protein
MAMTDWYKHLVTTTALTASDVFPPANPFLHVADTAPYYYGFHLVGASMARLAGWLTGADSAGDLVYPALLLLTLMTAAATPFVAYTVARTIAAGHGSGLGGSARVPLLAALGGTFLAGFDLIPLAFDTAVNAATGGLAGGGMDALRGAIPSTHLDYWIHHNERQFSAPYLTTIWAPQHMAGVLVALLVVHLVLRRRLAAERRGESAAWGAGWLLPALLLAGLPALSAYVAIGLVAGVLGAVLIESLRQQHRLWHTASWRTWLLPAVAAAALSLPVVAVLRSGAGPGFTVHVSDAGGWVNGALWSSLFGDTWLARLIDTAAVYVVELGVIGVLALSEIRRLGRNGRLLSHQKHVIAMVVSLLVLVTFMRPPVGGPNNLYARPLVFVWFLLAPFAAMRFARTTGMVTRAGGSSRFGRRASSHGDRRAIARVHGGGGSRRWTMAGVALCLLANGYALLGVVLEGSLFKVTPTATVEVAQWINDNAPADAVVGISPDDFVSGFGYWLRRPLALADERHALLFGASPADYERVATGLRQAVAGGGAPAAAAVDAAGATLLLLPSDAASTSDWSPSPCFDRVHDNATWLVFARTEASCDGGR